MNDMSICKKNYNIQPYIYLSNIALQFFCQIQFKPQKMMQINELEKIVDQYQSFCKDLTTKSLLSDILQIFQALQIITKNESSDIINWTGILNFLNVMNFQNENFNFIPDIEITLKNKTINDVFNKQINYFGKYVLKDLINFEQIFKKLQLQKQKQRDRHTSQLKIQELPSSQLDIAKDDNSSIINQQFWENILADQSFLQKPNPIEKQQFSEFGFAFLKGKSWRSAVNKLQFIIGRAQNTEKADQATKNIKYMIDLSFKNAKRVSRQHAVILYNFLDKQFEIKCLSKKYPIIVNQTVFFYKDPPAVLTQRSNVRIGSEQFYFMLPKIDNNEKIQDESNIIIEQ